MTTETFTESGTSPPTLAWHYTTMLRFGAIDKSKRINRANSYIEKGERAAVWFTTDDEFEPTALLMQGGRALTLEEQSKITSAVRIGVKLDRLQGYKTWKQRSKCSRNMQRILEKVAIEQGSNPHQDWHISFTPVTWMDWECIEVSQDGHNWTPF